MRKLRVIKWALKSICRNPTRTFLTTLGIVIGIAAVIALMEIGTGAREMLDKNMESMGVNTIRVWPGTITRSGVSSGASGRANITLNDVTAIEKNCPNVMAVSPVVNVRGQIIFGGKNWSPYSIIGVNENYLDIARWTISEGEPFSRIHVIRGSKVCLVGETIVRELYDGESPVGKDLRIQNVVFKVIGVLKAKGANMMGFDQDDTVIAPWSTVKTRLRGAGSTSLSSTRSSSSTPTATSTSAFYVGKLDLYPASSNSNRPPVRFANVDSLIIAAPTKNEVPLALAEVTEVMREQHRLSPTDEDDFRVRTMSEFTDMFTKQTETMTDLLLCVAFISLLVGGIGIMNIMLVSVTERTREIGLRMAVGARGGDILKQFLVESVVICLLGGMLGIVVGHGLSVLMTVLMKWPSSMSYSAIVLAVGVSAIVGVIFGYYPAWKAARLDPIEALRYE